MDLNRLPIRTPIQKPIKEIVNTTNEINERLKNIDTSKKASETPTASASMLVANAKVNILLVPLSFFSISRETEASVLAPSQIIFIPNRESRTNAIQWSYALIHFENCKPIPNPIETIPT